MFTSLRWLALTLGLGCIVGVGFTAEIPKPPDQGELSRATQLVDKMRSGNYRVINPDEPAETKKNKDAITTYARAYVLKLATAPYNGEPAPKDLPKTLGVDYTVAYLADTYERSCDIVPQPGTTRINVNQTDFGNALGNATTEAAKLILANSARPAELINAVRFMAIAAKMPCPDMADTFVELINNPKISDAMKLYAFQGLRKLLEQNDLIDQTKHIIGARDPAKLVAVTKALSDYILQNRQPRDAREAAVIQFVRVEAVAALARCRFAVLRKPNNEVLHRPGWTLARVFAADPNITPPFSVIERAEAAMGFAQMKLDKETNLDVAAYFVGAAFASYTQAMVQDYGNVNAGKGLPAYPWKVLSVRWSYALASWREQTKTGFRNNEGVKSLADVAITEVLTEVEKKAEKALISTDKLFNQWPQANAPKAWAENPPKQAILYNDDPSSVLPIAQGATLTTPKMPEPKMPDPKVPPKK